MTEPPIDLPRGMAAWIYSPAGRARLKQVWIEIRRHRAERDHPGRLARIKRNHQAYGGRRRR